MPARLGYFVTESSEHFAEYVPWFIKRDRPDLIEQFNVPLDEYIRRRFRSLTEFARTVLENPGAIVDHLALRQACRGRNNHELRLPPAVQPRCRVDRTSTPSIIHSIETGVPRDLRNVMNHGLIDNLFLDCVGVEVLCLVDKNGTKSRVLVHCRRS